MELSGEVKHFNVRIFINFLRSLSVAELNQTTLPNRDLLYLDKKDFGVHIVSRTRLGTGLICDVGGVSARDETHQLLCLPPCLPLDSHSREYLFSFPPDAFFLSFESYSYVLSQVAPTHKHVITAIWKLL